MGKLLVSVGCDARLEENSVMVKFTAREIFEALTRKEELIGVRGTIDAHFHGLSFVIKNRNIVGNMIQEWVGEWLKARKIDFAVKPNTQAYPDFFLNPSNKTIDLLEVKAFDYNRSANFDVSNFQGYCRSLKIDSFRLHADYLIFAYAMDELGEITIKKMWLKKVWEICGPSDAYPIKVQQKQKVIYNIRPVVWFSMGKPRYPPFETLQEFVLALRDTLMKYPRTKDESGTWLNDVTKNYVETTGKELFPKK